MKQRKRLCAAAAWLLSVGLLTGCSRLTVDSVMNVIAPTETPMPGADLTFETPAAEVVEPLQITYQEMDGLLSPFWAESDGDLRIVSLTQLPLLAERGDPSPAEYSREKNEDESTTVVIRLQDGLRFSDGEPLTSRDLLFTYYVLVDSDYDGPFRVNTLPIRGLSAYWNGMDLDMYAKYIMIYDEIYNLGRYDEPLQEALEEARQAARDRGVREYNLVWDTDVQRAQAALDAYDVDRAEEIRQAIDQAWRADMQTLVDYTLRNYSNSIELRTSFTRDQVLGNTGLQVMYTMLDRGFGSLDENGAFTIGENTWDLQTEFPTTSDMFRIMYDTYSGDPQKYWSVEGYGRSDMLAAVENELIRRWAPEDPDWRGTVDRVEGLQLLDDRTLAVTLEYCDDNVLRILTDVYIAPLHYYGDAASFDPVNGPFGFTRGDLNAVRALSRASLGAGEFVYKETDIRIVYLDPNDFYWLGKTEIPQVILSRES